MMKVNTMYYAIQLVYIDQFLKTTFFPIEEAHRMRNNLNSENI